jgi:hypothetical protein
MFPLMNKRQHQALVQSALQKINIYQQKQIYEQQKQKQFEQQQQFDQPKIETETKSRRQTLAEFKMRSELRRKIQQPIVVEEVPIVDENHIVDESIVLTMNEDPDIETVLSEVKQELTEAIQKQTEIESNLIAENAELKEQFVAEFVKEEPAEEMSLQIEEEETTSL